MPLPLLIHARPSLARPSPTCQEGLQLWLDGISHAVPRHQVHILPLVGLYHAQLAPARHQLHHLSRECGGGGDEGLLGRRKWGGGEG